MAASGLVPIQDNPHDRAQFVCDKTFSITSTSTSTVSLSTSRTDMFHPLHVLNSQEEKIFW
jgi:hypothetical protein